MQVVYSAVAGLPMAERIAHDAGHASTGTSVVTGLACHAAAIVGSVQGQALMLVLAAVDSEVVAVSFSASVGAGVAAVVVVVAVVAEEMVCS